MSRLPIRVRLTTVFALAMIAVFGAAALFVYVQLREDLDESLTAGLHSRADVAAAAVREGRPGLGDAPAGEPEEAFAQVLAPDGAVIEGTGPPALRPAELRRAREGVLVVERAVPGIEATARILARPAGERVVVVGQSLSDRDETLGGLIGSFAAGGTAAVVLASLIGYVLAAAALRPVEAMRRRAAGVTLSGERERLPLPASRDEVRRLGETLNDMLDRLQRSFERERRFVADASHELRTPIAVLKTEVEAALRAGDAGPDVRAALAAALAACDDLAQLAEDLLVLARSGDGRLPVRREGLDARAALERVRDRFADRAAQQQRGIAVDAPAGLGLSADPLRLSQALGNLVDNALRHGGGEIALAARPAGGGVELDVGDAGPGFPDGLGDGAFERFTRGDAARSRGGAGLGLAIVRAIADAHDGRATIVADPGATVRLWLPGAVSAAAQPAAPQSRSCDAPSRPPSSR